MQAGAYGTHGGTTRSVVPLPQRLRAKCHDRWQQDGYRETMPTTDAAGERSVSNDSSPPDDGLGQSADVPRGSWRDRIRSKPGLRQTYRIGVFLVGLLFIVLGLALAVLPGPLTIPPVLLGLWIWSTEFRFAQRFFRSFKAKAREAWAHAKRHPRSSTVITVGGLAAAGAAAWALAHFQLVGKAKEAIGL
jgi:hypothetical protein